ncbi:MAG TPA: 2-amino-4-hydroxy-6-hydroxymethyldihydropteridine diphosphokinase [Prolixibacteraceae bacterium]|nr:2-amino-4-hydroxy-6-hydroxymethyldihydropteridine diphosphokinase [Prolixibacteraceae bacterium]
MKKHECIIGIGSNINPEKNIAAALFFLRQEQEFVSVSSLIKTSPIGIPDQPDFLNGAAKILTTMEIADFKSYLKDIEDRLKRDRTAPKFGPRTIDLDIVIWDGDIVDPDYFSRDFLKTAVDEIKLT